LIKWFNRQFQKKAQKADDIRFLKMGLTRSLGERQYPKDPGSLEGIDPDHLFRYKWAEPYLAGKSVLDYGCGIGYGSFVMSHAASQVTGFDVSKDALAWADHYARQMPNLEYTDHLPEKYFDCVTCFECIEHVPDPESVLDWLMEHVEDRLFISTPEVVCGKKWSPHHTREFTRQEFLDLLSSRFAIEHDEIQLTNGCSVVLARCRKRVQETL
jgi:2-polyprenyl-3-methyl-5-hydroxy-6-metoxy-1,4-benzoquinol methylase